jgi:hypothetical protein
MHKLPLVNKTDVNTNYSMTPVRMAAESGFKDIVKLLRQHGCHE